MFSCEFYEIFKNTFVKDQPWATASSSISSLTTNVITLQKSINQLLGFCLKGILDDNGNHGFSNIEQNAIIRDCVSVFKL